MKNFELHERENNSESEAHLKANHKKFSKQCALTLEVLRRGERLTTRTAILFYGIGDLRRRIKDLKDMHDIEIDDEWELDDDGKTTRNKVWFINFKTQRETKKSLVEWGQRYVEAFPQKYTQLNLL